MAEFCVKSWNEINNSHEPKSAFVLSDELELCENCGEWKRVIVCYREPLYIKLIFFIIDIIKKLFSKRK